MANRRAEDKCLIKRLYAKYTPHIQGIGYISMFCVIILTAHAIYNEVRAFGPRITAIERAQMRYIEDQKDIKRGIESQGEMLQLIVQILQIQSQPKE